eukprot:5914434-Alexandrium_andersonii.AAC.1
MLGEGASNCALAWPTERSRAGVGASTAAMSVAHTCLSRGPCAARTSRFQGWQSPAAAKVG